jgi:hypothetical protein
MYLEDVTDRKEKFEKYFTSQVSLGKDRWLVLNRIINYDGCYGDEAIELKVEDNILHTSTLLGVFSKGRWESPNGHANQLWMILKDHRSAVNRALNRLTTPTSDLRPFVFEWKCFKRRFKLQSIRVKRKIKNL